MNILEKIRNKKDRRNPLKKVLGALAVVGLSTTLVAADIAPAAAAMDVDTPSLSIDASELFNIDSIDAEASGIWHGDGGGREQGSGGNSRGWRWNTAESGNSRNAWEQVQHRFRAGTCPSIGGAYFTSINACWNNYWPSVQSIHWTPFGGSPSVIRQCSQSTRPDSWIWYVSAVTNPGGRANHHHPVAHHGGSTRGIDGSNSSRIHGQGSGFGGAVSQEKWDAYISTLGSRLWNSGNLVIVCSTPAMEQAANGPKIESGTAYWYFDREIDTSSEAVSRMCRGAHRQIVVDPGFERNRDRTTPINRQASNDKDAAGPCGDLFNALNGFAFNESRLRSVLGSTLYNAVVNGSPTESQFRQALERANSASTTSMVWELTSHNQRALAEGNIANITYRSRDVNITWSEDSSVTLRAVSRCRYFYEVERNGRMGDIVEIDCNPGRTGTYPGNSTNGRDSGLTTGSTCNMGQFSQGTVSNSERSALNSYLRNRCPDTGVRNLNNENDSGWVSRVRSNSSVDLDTSAPEMRIDTFYQTMGVTCNVDDFNNAVSAVNYASGATVENASGSNRPNDRIFTGIAYTNSVHGRDAMNARANRDWGRSNNANAALARTGSLEFFTKECNFSAVGNTGNQICPPDGNVHAANPQSGARFGSLHNAVHGQRGATPDQSFGPGTSASETTANNELAFTRDNVWDRIELEVPAINTAASSSLVNVQNSGLPIRTLVSRSDNSSLNVIGDDSTAGGLFRMRSVNDSGDSHQVFLASENQTGRPEITNAAPPAGFSTKNMRMFESGLNKFDVRANWYTDSGSPEVINVAWGYNTGINTTLYAGIAPRSEGSNRYNFSHRTLDSSQPREVTTVHYGRCQADFSGANNYDVANHLYENTGAGVEYVSPQDDRSTSRSNTTSTSTNLVINFLRGVSER